MKPILFLSIFLTPLFFFSCKEDDPVEPEQPEEQIEYYVKYEVETVSKDSFPEINVYYTYPMGTQYANVSRNWEAVFGPFYRLQHLQLMVRKVRGEQADSVSFTGRISVCLAGSNRPFAVKAFDTWTDSLYLSYTMQKYDIKSPWW